MNETDSHSARQAYANSVWRSAYAKVLNPAFVRLLDTWGYGRVFTRADQCHIEDETGRQYLDALSGFGSFNLGHYPPRISQRIRDFLEAQALNLCHTGIQPDAVRLAEKLGTLLPPLDRVMFSNSGSEAVEAAIKLARAATGRQSVLYSTGSFHGTNLGSLSILDSPRWQRPFRPLLPECFTVPCGDLDALHRALKTRKVAVFILEPVQAEGGVRILAPEYLQGALQLCQQYGTLLALDEVQTGLCRTGKWFSCQHAGIVPDILILAKALGAGLVSIGATLTRPELHHRAFGQTRNFDLHSSTYGGNALATVVALENLVLLEEFHCADRAQQHGDLLLSLLRQGLKDHPLVQDIRGQGLLIGIEMGTSGKQWQHKLLSGLYRQFSQKAFGQWLALQLLEHGVICQPCSLRWDVLRLEPALIMDQAHIELLARKVVSVLNEWQSPVASAQAMIGRVAEQRRMP